MNERFLRSAALIGEDKCTVLSKARITVFGVGGVGGYVVETLARLGVGSITVVDADTVSVSNINRQIIALTSTLGMKKAEIAEKRIADINPDANAIAVCEFVTGENVHEILRNSSPDFVVDAIDTLTSKVAIIQACKEMNIPVISSMGTGNKLDPTRLRISDISKTNTCPLARTMRLKLREAGIDNVEVLWSDENPRKVCTDSSNGRHSPASIAFVPSVAGILIARRVAQRIVGGF